MLLLSSWRLQAGIGPGLGQGLGVDPKREALYCYLEGSRCWQQYLAKHLNALGKAG